MRILNFVILIYCFLQLSCGQVKNLETVDSTKHSFGQEQIFATDSILSQFYDSLLVFIREDLISTELKNKPLFDDSLPYFIDSVSLKILYIKGDMLSLINIGEEANICFNLLDRKSNRMRSIYFLTKVQELGGIPVNLIEFYKIRFNLNLYDQVYLKVGYKLSYNGQNFTIINKQVLFPNSELNQIK